MHLGFGANSKTGGRIQPGNAVNTLPTSTKWWWEGDRRWMRMRIQQDVSSDMVWYGHFLANLISFLCLTWVEGLAFKPPSKLQASTSFMVPWCAIDFWSTAQSRHQLPLHLDQSGATAPSDVPAPWWHGQYLSTCLVPQLSSTDHFHELILWASQQHGFLHSFALVKPVTGNLCHNPSNSINSWHLKLSQLSMYSIPQKCLGLCNMFFF